MGSGRTKVLERSRAVPGRRRRGGGVSDALETLSGGRGCAAGPGRVDSTASLGAGPEASGALPEL